MGKRKNQTHIHVNYKQNKKITKKRQAQSRLLSFSTSNILKCPDFREQKIIKNVKVALRKFINHDQQGNKRKLMSALNIPQQNEVVCSAMNIPSIENMLVSKNQLCSYGNCNQNFSQSGVSLIESMEFCILENQPELMLSYIYLVQKAINKLGIPLSPQQNQKLLKGIWNILTKFWSDDFVDLQYPNLSAKIQWGILQLLNFDLKVGKKQRVLMETKIRSLNFLKQ